MGGAVARTAILGIVTIVTVAVPALASAAATPRAPSAASAAPTPADGKRAPPPAGEPPGLLPEIGPAPPAPVAPATTPPAAIEEAKSVPPGPSATPSTGAEEAGPSSAAGWSAPRGDLREGLDPLPSRGEYLSYGVAFHSDALLSSGHLCASDSQCVIGGGAGLSFVGSYRTPRYTLGGAYAATFHDSSSIYQRGVLQQLRAEWRYRPRSVSLGQASFFVAAGGGGAAYGDNWAVATFGASGHGGVGVELDLGVKVSLVFASLYRAIYFRSFDDASGEHRGSSVVHFLGLQLGLELHEPT